MAIIPAEEKVFMVSNSTNTTYSGSAALKAMQQWYTMEDVTNTVRPYKVFTALLTQSGGDETITLYEGDDFQIGVTYTIDYIAPGVDLSFFGAPNNLVGTSFICTSIGPLPACVLTYNTGAPVATVLENTIGNIWFTYNDVGSYKLTSNGLFTINKTIQFLNNILNEEGDLNIANYPDINQIYFLSKNQSGETTNGGFNNTPIEIRVYN